MDQLSFTIGAFVGASAATMVIVITVLAYIGIRDGAKAEERYRLKCEMEQAIERQAALRQGEAWDVRMPVSNDTRMVTR